MKEVRITDEMRALASILGAMRSLNAKANGIRDAKMGKQNGVDGDQLGILGELAFCQMHNVWPDQLIAMEVEGGVWNGGRHGRGSGIVKDIEKGNAAVLLGWQMLRATGDMVKSGEAVKLLEEYFNSEEVK